MIACGNPASIFVVPNEAVKADSPLLDQFMEMIDVIDVLFSSFSVDITQYCHRLHPPPVPWISKLSSFNGLPKPQSRKNPLWAFISLPSPHEAHG